MRTLTIALLLSSVVAAASFLGCSDTTNNNFSFAPQTNVGAAGETGEAGAENEPGAAGSAGELSDAGSNQPADASVDSAVSAYLSSLPGWPAPDPDSNEPVAGADAGAPNYVTGTDGIEYACTTSEWSLTSTPTQIVTFNPNVDVLWPGALLQGKPYRDGELIGLPITQRAPLVISIPTLLSAKNSQVVDQPTVASTEDAVGSLISSAIDAGIEASSSVSYTQTEAHSTSQVSLALGFSADFVGGALSGQLDLSESAELNTVVGYFVQSMFTVTVPEPEQPSDLFSGLSQATVDQLSAQGEIGNDNLPLYVASVVYGRIMMFSITSKESTEDIEAALAAEFHGLVASGSVQSKYSSLIDDSSTSFRVVTVGGSAANAEALINTGDPSKFFDSNPAISTGVPISYVVRNLSDNSVAGVSETTSYTVKTCEATAQTGANYYVVDAHQQKVLAFDSSGNDVELAYPILLGSDFLPNNSDIAYDPNDDRIFIHVGQLLNAYSSDGSPLVDDGTEVPTTTQSLSFDVQHGQLYSTGPDAVDVQTSTGAIVVRDAVDCTVQTLYVPSQDALYCLYGVGGIGAYTFGLYDNVDFPDDAFSEVYDALSPSAIALGEYEVYDAFNDRILIGFDTDVWSFTPVGKLVTHFPLKGHLKGLARDTVSHRVAAVLDNGTVQLFQDDGTLVPLADGAFPGISDARGIVFRQ